MQLQRLQPSQAPLQHSSDSSSSSSSSSRYKCLQPCKVSRAPSCTCICSGKKSKKRKQHSQQLPQQQQQQQQGPSSSTTWVDPRLQWARPEWIQQQNAQQQPNPTQSNHNSSNSSSTSSSGIAAIAAAARRSPTGSSSTLSGPMPEPLTPQEQQALLDKITYGSYSDSEDAGQPITTTSSSSSSSSSISRAAIPQPFAAMGIDYGRVRVGVAVHRAGSNIPLLTLQQQQQQLSDQPDGSSSSSSHNQTRPDFNSIAQSLLQCALGEGCDAFVMGVPTFDLQRYNAPRPGIAAAAGSAAAAAAGGSRAQKVLRPNTHIRWFAQVLANAAAAYDLPVILVNEQQSTRQAKAMLTGKATYDISSPEDHQQRQQQQQQERRQQQEGQKQQRPGRDAYAAALILSRYYNGLVEPLEVVRAQPQHTQGQQQQQQQAPGRVEEQGLQQQEAKLAAAATPAALDSSSSNGSGTGSSDSSSSSSSS